MSIFQNIEGNTIELLVIANVLLVPSNDLYVPLHSIIQYGAVIVKQDSTQRMTILSSKIDFLTQFYDQNFIPLFLLIPFF